MRGTYQLERCSIDTKEQPRQRVSLRVHTEAQQSNCGLAPSKPKYLKHTFGDSLHRISTVKCQALVEVTRNLKIEAPKRLETTFHMNIQIQNPLHMSRVWGL